MPLDVEPYQLSFRRLSRDRATLAYFKAARAAIIDPKKITDLVGW